MQYYIVTTTDNGKTQEMPVRAEDGKQAAELVRARGLRPQRVRPATEADWKPSAAEPETPACLPLPLQDRRNYVYTLRRDSCYGGLRSACTIVLALLFVAGLVAVAAGIAQEEGIAILSGIGTMAWAWMLMQAAQCACDAADALLDRGARK